MEWASATVPENEQLKSGRISTGYETYFDDDGINKAHYPAAKTIEALIKTKQMIDDFGGYDKVKFSTLNNLKSEK